jgi:hypothetical protein
MYFVTSQRGREVFVLEAQVYNKIILNNPNVSHSWVGGGREEKERKKERKTSN